MSKHATGEGSSTDVRLVPRKAFERILKIVVGSTTVPREEQPLQKSLGISMMFNLERSKDKSEEQSRKAASAMEVRPGGSVMEVSEEQCVKALFAMEVRPGGSVMEVSERQR